MSDDRRPSTPTDEHFLDELRQLLAAGGKLTSSLIEASKITRAPNTYIRRFGSLVAAYAHIGYQPSDRQRATSARFQRRVRWKREPLTRQISIYGACEHPGVSAALLCLAQMRTRCHRS